VIRRPLQHALDELRFGRSGTLNLRASLPTAAEAVKRTESWLRMKQAEGAREVLIVTGRGNHSFARIGVVREAVQRLLGYLSTRGIVEHHSEHSPGSFAVRLLPMTATVKGRETQSGSMAVPIVSPPTLDGLAPATRDQLRVLASGTLQALGMRDPSSQFVHDEMERQCVQLAATLPPAATADEREASFRLAIARAIERLDDDQR
jgi:Smr domain-containing protein